MPKTKIYKGLDLLAKVLEFNAMTPNKEHWNEGALKNNPPRLIRLKQIQSLAQAFLIKGADSQSTILSILIGDFIKERSVADYMEVFTFIEEVVREKEGETSKYNPTSTNSLRMPYQQLINYKKQLLAILDFNSGWLEAGTINARFSIYLTDSITKHLVGKYEKLDKALELFINPGKLSFTETELITNYNFPPDNLHDIDMEYM
jgi:hypothetical protein